MQDSNIAPKLAEPTLGGDSLAACFDQALACLPMAVAQCLADIHADLSGRAGLLDGASEQLLQLLSRRSDDLVQSFQAQLAKQMPGKTKPRYQASAQTGGGRNQVALMLEEEHYDFTAPQAIASAIEAVCLSELFGLNKRFELMLRPIPHRNLPFGPQPIGQAVMAALKSIGMPLKIRQQLLPRLLDCLPNNIKDAYQALNQGLIERGILPQMTAGAPVGVQGHPAPSAEGARPANDTGQSEPPLFRDLSAMCAADPGSIGKLELEIILSGGINLAREIDLALQAQLNATDKVVLNWLAVLFDGVFMRSDLESGYRAVFSRLQWPMLKVALRDKEQLIDDLAHPAQRLFGAWVAVADSQRGLAGCDEATLSRMRALVAELSVSDLPDFAVAWQAWSAGVASPHSYANDTASFERFAEPVRTAVAERRVPRAMEAFLVEHRLALLAGIAANGGQNDPDWHEATAALDELLATMEPANWRRHRAELSASLPGLLKRLRMSMESAGMAAGACDRFFGMLVKYHAVLMKAAQGRPAKPN